MKTCCKCNKSKQLYDFVKNKRVSDGRGTICKKCKSLYDKEYHNRDPLKRIKYHRSYYQSHKDESFESSLLKNYGITLKYYNEIEKEQGGVCLICQKTCNSKRRLAVDHCHKTGKIRGLLCMKHNRGIGAFDDDIELLKKAINYLDQ